MNPRQEAALRVLLDAALAARTAADRYINRKNFTRGPSHTEVNAALLNLAVAEDRVAREFGMPDPEPEPERAA